MISRPLDRERPRWEMYVIEGLDNIKHLPKGSFAIMTKIHHAAADGVVTEHKHVGAGTASAAGARRKCDPAVPKRFIQR